MANVLTRTDLPGQSLFGRGKVRDTYDLGDKLLIVVTDRISAFDVVLPNGIPGKGAVLNQLSAYWFRRMASIMPNHFLSEDVAEYPAELQPFAEQLRGRSMLVVKAQRLDVECVVRGYLAGSGWAEYKAEGTVCGHHLPAGLRQSDKLPEPIFTPATKEESGHDLNITVDEFRRLLGADLADQLIDSSLAIYKQAEAEARAKGIIIADTKFEFGLVDGEPIQIDEMLTPDSSRFWPADAYAPGMSPPSFDKQYVRDWLEASGWNKESPAPTLPEEVVAKTGEKYREAFRRLAGTELKWQ
ncbi:MAG: phosphoribosylaminoimidazolesuccinocarboxamide synthase [Dehalococcoidales bacterium]|nr:phosphoribosylaminoimidazolesuccinocarboxamide synthase [Dehalococcoidales bacterium]